MKRKQKISEDEYSPHKKDRFGIINWFVLVYYFPVWKCACVSDTFNKNNNNKKNFVVLNIEINSY